MCYNVLEVKSIFNLTSKIYRKVEYKLLGNESKKGKAYSVYCTPKEIQIIDKVRDEFKAKSIQLSNSEILKMAIRKLGDEYEK